MFQNSYFFLTIPRLYVTVLIRKINSSSSLFPSAQNHEFKSHISAFFVLRIDKLTVVELNQVTKSELGDIKLHFREKKFKIKNCEVK